MRRLLSPYPVAMRSIYNKPADIVPARSNWHMIKYIVSIALTGLLSFICGLYLPWWSIALAAFLVGLLIPQKPFMSYLAAFLGVFLLWEFLAWWIDYKNNSILSQKIAQLMQIGGSTGLLILLTSLVGALVAGFAALTGCYLRRVMAKAPPRKIAE